MRITAANIANALAWAVIVLLICAAVVLADVLGFLGLLILGAFTWLICLRAELDNDTPTWGTEVFRARMNASSTPEQRAAMFHERLALISPLRFYRWCGIGLVTVGLAGFVYRQWRPWDG